MRDPVTVDWTIIGETNELNIHGGHLGLYCYPIALDMLRQGRLPMERSITERRADQNAVDSTGRGPLRGGSDGLPLRNPHGVNLTLTERVPALTRSMPS
jgi:hypothetical protein